MVAFLWSVLSFSCSQAPQGGWPWVDPETDSINNLLDDIYIDHPIVEGKELIQRLQEKSNKNPENKLLRGEYLYWQSLLLQKDYPDSCWKLQSEIRQIIDSASYPYIIARLDMQDAPEINKDNFLTRHSRLKEIVDYFHNVGDIRSQLMATRHLGSFFVKIGDMEKYKETSAQINHLCHLIGNDTLIAKSALNLALAEIHVGDSTTANEILNKLLHDSVVEKDSVFLSRVYINLGEVNNDPLSFQKALELNRGFRETPYLYNTIRFSMMKKYETNGDYAKSDSLFKELYPLVKAEGDAEARIFSHRILLRQAQQRGDYKMVAQEKDSIEELKLIIFSPAQYEELTTNIYKEALAKEEQKVIKEKADARLTVAWIVVVVSVMLIFGIGIFIRYKKKERLRHRRDEDKIGEMEKELDKERAQTLAMSQSLAERDRLIKDISEMTENLQAEESATGEMKENLLKHIKLAQININEWDDFQAAYSKIHPLFLKKLKEAYPDITEGDSRLALYIAAGLSSKEIAKVMQLQPDSIKKNRQRLRQRMHISSNEELESSLRNLL